MPKECVSAKDREEMANALACDDGGQELGTKQDDGPNLKAIKHYLTSTW